MPKIKKKLENPADKIIESPGYTVERKGLQALFKKLSIAMSTEDARYYLKGVLFEKKGSEVTFVSTNGHKMVVIDALKNFDCIFNPETDADFTYIIPRIAIDDFLKLKINCYDFVGVRFIDNKFVSFSFDGDNQVRTYKLIDATYPDWRRVVPADFTPYTAFNPKYVAEICKAMGKSEVIVFQAVPMSDPELTQINPSVITNERGAKFILMPKRI